MLGGICFLQQPIASQVQRFQNEVSAPRNPVQPFHPWFVLHYLRKDWGDKMDWFWERREKQKNSQWYCDVKMRQSKKSNTELIPDIPLVVLYSTTVHSNCYVFHQRVIFLLPWRSKACIRRCWFYHSQTAMKQRTRPPNGQSDNAFCIMSVVHFHWHPSVCFFFF